MEKKKYFFSQQGEDLLIYRNFNEISRKVRCGS